VTIQYLHVGGYNRLLDTCGTSALVTYYSIFIAMQLYVQKCTKCLKTQYWHPGYLLHNVNCAWLAYLITSLDTTEVDDRSTGLGCNIVWGIGQVVYNNTGTSTTEEAFHLSVTCADNWNWCTERILGRPAVYNKECVGPTEIGHAEKSKVHSLLYYEPYY